MFVLKKALAIFICIVILLSMSACQKINPQVESTMSDDIYQSESLIITESQSETASTDTDKNSTDNEDISSIESNTTKNTDVPHTNVSSNTEESSSENATSSKDEASYDDIVCNKIYSFQQAAFSIKGSNEMLFVKLPQEWSLQKQANGYNILKNSQAIGSVTTSVKTTSNNESTNVFNSTITSNNIAVTHSIERVTTNNSISFNRTFCYSYNDERGNNKKLFITIPYQEVDSSAVFKMITDVKTDIASTNSNLGLLKIEDNRNKILILGNSFIGSSRIGRTLQTMCGDKIYVEAIATGYAHVGTYTKNPTIMQKIRDGNYSVVFICGLYDQEAVNDLADMIKACDDSFTKLAVFPAHNENQEKINHALSLYHDTIFLNWKDEINNLINKGIDVSNFCIPDSHKHSTPLAGYVGAHMIYRAIFNEIPTATQFDDVSQAQISLLGEYTSTGIIKLIENDNSYVIE